jgi:hypothetical protein
MLNRRFWIHSGVTFMLLAVALASGFAAGAQDTATPTPSPTPTRDPEIPGEVYVALAAFDPGYDAYPNNVLDYSFTYFSSPEDWSCGERPVPENVTAFYSITITGRTAPDGGILSAVYLVPLFSSDAYLCGGYYEDPTPTLTRTPSLTPSFTATVDLTRVSATPTATASRTPSSTPTWTPSRTPSSTPTATQTLTPSATRTFTATITPTASLTPRPDSVTCPGFMPSRLVAGELAEVISSDPIRMRAEPSRSGAEIRQLQTGFQLGVIEGPECDEANGLAWWRVQFGAQTGWIAEGAGDEYFVEPLIGVNVTVAPGISPTRSATRPASASDPVPVTCPGFLPSRLVIGESGRVLPGTPNNVRAAADAGASPLGQIPGGGVFAVLDGPTCDPAGRAWWQVEFNGLVGWTVEGQGSTYFVEPVTN